MSGVSLHLKMTLTLK